MIHISLLGNLSYHRVYSRYMSQQILKNLDLDKLTKFIETYGNLKPHKLEKLKKTTKGKGRPTFYFPAGPWIDRVGFAKHMKSWYNLEFGGGSWLKPYYDSSKRAKD